VTTVTWMADATGTNAHLLPSNTPFVGGYISGSGGVQWAPGEWNRFTGKKVRIYQGVGPVPALLSFDEIDVEDRAVTPQGAAQIVRMRVDAGITWTQIYGSRDKIRATNQEIQKLGTHYWNGHVTCRLADWNLNEAQATALVNTYVEGSTCTSVQWASDSSNPNTLVPGTNVPLKAGVDLNVVDASWVPSLIVHPAPPPVPAPPAKTLVSIGGTFSDGSTQQFWHD
jgi:hypothetical protein